MSVLEGHVGSGIIIDVEARLTNLDRGLVEGQRKLDRFAAEAERTGDRVDRALARPGKGRLAADALLGDVRALRAQADVLVEQAGRVEQANTQAGASFGRVAAGGIAAGVAVKLITSNLGELGGGYARADRAITALFSGQIVKGWREARSEVVPTTAELMKYGDVAELIALRNSAAAAGFDKLAASAQTASLALQAAQGSFVDPTKIRDSTSPGAIAAEVSGIAAPDPLVGLPQNLKTAIAGAQAGFGDPLAQLRRAEGVLNKQLGQGGLTDKDRETIYDAIAALNAQIELLTKKPPAPDAPIVPLSLDVGLSEALLTKDIGDDLSRLQAIDSYLVKRIAVETDQNRKLQELQRLGQVRKELASLSSTGTVVNDLFGGGFLNSDEFRRAESFGYTPSGQDLLKDLQAQVRQADQFATDLAKIRKRGGSDELVQSLAVADPDSVHALAGASTSVFRKYGQLFGRRADQAEGMSKLADNVNIFVNTKSEAEGVQKGLKQAGFTYMRGKL